jgi:hypothetical protein
MGAPWVRMAYLHYMSTQRFARAYDKLVLLQTVFGGSFIAAVS